MKRLMAILLTVVLLLGFAACTDSEQVTEPSAEPSTVPSTEPSAAGLLLETPVGVLEYSADFASNARLESKEEDGLYSYTLYGSTGVHEALLFTVYIGERGEGQLFGFAPDSQGILQAIYVQIAQFQGDETWDQQELDLIHRMQQQVNGLIDQIYELPGFQE